MLVFSDLIGDAFDSWFVPVLGFFLLPWTTLAYALMWGSGANGVGLAFVFDLASWTEGRRQRAAR